MVKRLTAMDLVRESLELELFFLRIMKEHAFFLKGGFLRKDSAFIEQADLFEHQYENLLREVVPLANGNVSSVALGSGEFVTANTLEAEQRTEALTGMVMDPSLTRSEMQLTAGQGEEVAREEKTKDEKTKEAVAGLNIRALDLTLEFADFKMTVLNSILNNTLYSFNFSLLIEHMRKEALSFAEHLQRLHRGEEFDAKTQIIGEKVLGDRIMADHAKLMSHWLDPVEQNLINQANNFAAEFQILERRALENKLTGAAVNQKLLLEETTATRNFRNFKKSGTEQIIAGKIKSLMLPLFADHVVREGNHFLRILTEKGFAGIISNDITS